MYVADLKDNMLIVPAPGLAFQFVASSGPELEEFVKYGAAGHLLVHKKNFIVPGYGNFGTDPALYMFCRNDDWLWGGVYKHHYMLIQGQVCIVDGYQFKDMVPVGKK